ncbi:MAG: PIN domain-containing protein [Azoarcus sp.]|jgi:predicted nucleic acid-binding protein|nr:PIN domain-containing protein [Azoarcus sp.]
MKNKAHDIAIYSFRQGEPVLIDTNVWVYLYPPAAQPAQQQLEADYSRAFGKLLQAKATPIIDALILSEYINRYLRIEYKVWEKRHTGDAYKTFRRSAEGLQLACNAAAEVRCILKDASLRDTRLQGASIESIITGIETGGFDFNDGVLIENCRLQGWKLLTHDSDMTIGGIELLTANRKLLQVCREA